MLKIFMNFLLFFLDKLASIFFSISGFFLSHSILIMCLLLFIAFTTTPFLIKKKKEVAIEVSIICFYISLIMFSCFSPLTLKFQFFNEYKWLYSESFLKINIVFGVDGISIYFLMLTTFLMPLCFFLENRNREYTFQSGFLLCLISIEFFVLIAFTSLDLFIFFLAFESILIPMFFIIGIFGTNRRRIKAAYYFFMYSFVSSLASLMAILYIYSFTGTLNFLVLQDYMLNTNQQIFCWLLLFITFSAKIPMFPFHIWLPEAHVEAPTVGSMILASLLLKLGGYGFLRFSLALFPEGTFYFLPVVRTLALLSIVYASFAALYQLDLKKIIAYSSIAHMNLAVLGIFSLNITGIQGAIFTMLSHGVVSAALFLIIGSIYDRFSTRSITYLGGLNQITPLLSSYFFFFLVCNISFPGTGAFIGEFLTLIGIYASNPFVYFCTVIGTLLCGVYSLRTLSFVCFGTLPANNYKYETASDLSREEDYCLRIFLISACFLGIKPGLFLNLCYPPIKALLLSYKI